jgi:hypothetical protein
MHPRPPVQPLRESLPFHGSAFGWETFEDFFCDFLNAQPVMVLNDGGTEVRRRVIRARPFGRKGDRQFGIDLLGEMEGGEVWDFQCKHVKEWSPQKTRDAINAYERSAQRRILLVTCEVSEECYNIVGEHPGWTLWDAREINRRFRELDALRAAPILFTHFGPGWAEAFFGISGDGPLIGAEAKFKTFLRPDIRFHHRHALIGRTGLVEQLDAFVRDEKARVFIVTGRGGLGKSRLLLHWSRDFNGRHPGYTLRFLSDKCADFGPSLQVAPVPLALAFDDAHRLDDVRRALFHELPRREHIKLVLSLRPGPIGQVMQELLAAGFDTTEIITGEPMKPLTAAQSMELVDAALKPEFSKHRHFLYSASRDCPLIAVVGAELINSGALSSGDLLDEKDLQRLAFESLLDDAAPVCEEFGTQPTDDFLRLLALLGPVKLDAAFFAKAAPFIVLPHADRVSHLRDALDAVGLLHTTGAGTRVTPDLLSDHLAYTACYDHTGQSRTFAERLLDHFSPEDFPKFMQHLAEAEWRALDELPQAASVVEPLWQWFRARFERSSFHDRKAQIQEWANIAHLQPRRSLELAELAVSLTTAPPPEFKFKELGRWAHHDYCLESLPQMLGGVAEHHPVYVARCFGLLWQLGRDKPPGSFNNDQGHPISVIGDVVSYKYGKTLEVCDAALNWLERLLAGDEWQQDLHKPGWLLGKFLTPLFATSVEENWSTGRQLHLRSHPLHLPNTASLRARVLAIYRKLLARGDAQLASQIIPVLNKGCDIARMGFGGSPTEKFIEAWDIERLKSLAVFEEMAGNFTEPLLQFQVRRALQHYLRYGKGCPAFRDACRSVVTRIPDTLDLRIARTAFGNCHDEFERDTHTHDWQVKEKARWETFIREVADATHTAHLDAGAWLAHLTSLDRRWRAFDSFQPNFRHLLVALAERHPAEGIAAAEILVRVPGHPLAHAFDALAMTATKSDSEMRLRLIREAAESSSEDLQTAAVACCTWWRREGELPEAAWQILEAFAPTAPTHIANGIANFVRWHDKRATLRDWHLVTALPFSPEQSALAGHIAARAADLISDAGLRPDAESVARFLSRYESLAEPEDHDSEHAFEKLAEAFPVEMFLMLWRRSQARKAGDTSLKPLPYDFARIQFRRVMSAPEVKALVADCERRLTEGEKLDFDEMRLLRSAVQHGSDDPSAWLEAAANRATTEEQLNALRGLGAAGDFDNAALAHPGFIRCLLARARAISPECHERVFSRLLHVGGSRGSTNGEPDPEWKGLIEAVERLAEQHSADPELGPLFSTIAKHERAWIESNRQRSAAEEQEE